MDLWLSSLKRNALKLLITEIDSVFLESGFVLYKTRPEKSPDWYDSDHNSTISVSYTLPALILGNNDPMEEKVPPLVQVKFQPLCSFLVICGSLARDGSLPRMFCFNKTGEFASVIASGGVLGFRRRIKDELCFPLLIDIAEEAGLPGPNCFSTLPSELKLGIMALLPAKAAARMECVCSSLRSLSSSSSNQLWEARYREVFGKVQVGEALSSSSVEKNWRELFVRRVEKRKVGVAYGIAIREKAKKIRFLNVASVREQARILYQENHISAQELPSSSSEPSSRTSKSHYLQVRCSTLYKNSVMGACSKFSSPQLQ
ncbi:unnamed protein product [Linum trigynum]|uniref:F-box domain-containing protein n=1 Tax=Linum trigynum TaxID=586398 RepID=A0AAV2G364_9ROSI